MRPIDADKLNLYRATHSELIEEIENAPTIERPKGKWLIRNNVDDVNCDQFGNVNCDQCGALAHYDGWGGYIMSDFCPNCGADMRE